MRQSSQSPHQSQLTATVISLVFVPLLHPVILVCCVPAKHSGLQLDTYLMVSHAKSGDQHQAA